MPSATSTRARLKQLWCRYLILWFYGVMDEMLEFETDARGRLSIARLGAAVKGRRWLGTMEDDGTVVLRPATLVPDSQLRFMRNPEAQAAVDRAFHGTGNPMKRDRNRRA